MLAKRTLKCAMRKTYINVEADEASTSVVVEFELIPKYFTFRMLTIVRLLFWVDSKTKGLENVF